MAGAEQNRSEAATPHKLKKAREEGQVAKSRDLSLAVVLLATMLYASSQAWPVWRQVFEFARALMVEAGSGALDPALLEALLGRMIHVCLNAVPRRRRNRRCRRQRAAGRGPGCARIHRAEV